MKSETLISICQKVSVRSIGIVGLGIANFICVSTVWAQDAFTEFSFDELRAFQNPALPDPEYLSHDGYYTKYLEVQFNQELLNLTNGASSYQGMINYQWYPDFGKEYAFKWNFGAGGFIDKFGPTEFLSFSGRAGVQWISPAGDVFGLGLAVGYQHQKIDLSGIELLQFGDPLAGSAYYQKSPDAGLGLFYNKRIFKYHDLFLGMSIPHLFTLETEGLEENWMINKSISFQAGANIYSSEYGYWEPSFYLQTKGRTIFNLRHHFRKSFWLGAGYDTRNLANAEFGMRFRNLTSQPQLVKSQLNYWRLGFSYRFWNGANSSIVGNRLGLRLAYIWN
ncbi:MAG: type IX secretion system membrane protein PorP/SprF [Saprospiraceae bacterium]|nr:type IX secretion system membrane protein PorP/SprF [Saprospiraceae bacterium]